MSGPTKCTWVSTAPAVRIIRIGERPDAQASARVQTLFGLDQQDRRGVIDWNVVAPRDQARQAQAVLRHARAVGGAGGVEQAHIALGRGRLGREHLAVVALAALDQRFLLGDVDKVLLRQAAQQEVNLASAIAARERRTPGHSAPTVAPASCVPRGMIA